MSDTGEFRFNLQNIIEKGIVSPAYPVFKVKEEYNAEFVEYKFPIFCAKYSPVLTF